MKTLYFVFDAESVGLHGEAFAVGGGLYTAAGAPLWEFIHACYLEGASGEDDDRKWVSENVPPLPADCREPGEVRERFWAHWEAAKTYAEKEGAKLYAAADCAWPVEGKLFSRCVRDDMSKRKWSGPYPLIDIASVLFACGFDPVGTLPRIDNELPAHNPLNDARQSARVLCEAIQGRLAQYHSSSGSL